MPFAAVLTRSSCCFYFRLLRFHARKGISGSGLCPVTMLRHLVNLQARIHSVKESRYFIYEFTSAPRPPRPCIIVVLHSGTHWATWTTLALCRGICLQWRCCLALRGMAAPMIRPLMRILPFIPGCLLAAIALPNPLHAQLVRENTPPPQVSAKQDAPNAASTQTPNGKKRLSQEVQLTGQQSWIDTGIDVQAGEHVLVTATGKLRYVDAKDDTGDGTYVVRIEVYVPEGAAARVVAKQVSSLPGIDNNLFSKIPRRVGDKEGNAGDMVNFLILGSEDAMQRVFTNSGWVKVDADVKATVLHGLIESLSKESYLTMPMSQLYLFGRPQDYGWAHAEPISVVRSRNHLRIWKASFQVSGETLWVGAATHDIGFERDERNNGVTHKIDPDIDLERDYVEKTLSSTGLVTEVAHFLPPNPMKEAKTATGGTFHSNGQLLILKLDESAPTP